jgi:hypothetical protein
MFEIIKNAEIETIKSSQTFISFLPQDWVK